MNKHLLMLALAILLTAFAVGGSILQLSPAALAGGELAAPPDTTAYWPRQSLMNGTWYSGGMVWLQSLACTTALKERGFIVSVEPPWPIRDDVDSTLLGIGVRWPVTLPRDSFPSCVFSIIPDRPLNSN